MVWPLGTVAFRGTVGLAGRVEAREQLLDNRGATVACSLGSAATVDRRRQCQDHGTRSAGTGGPGALRTPHRLSSGRSVRVARQTVREAERRFPVCIRIAVPPGGLGSRLDQIIVWLDAIGGGRIGHCAIRHPWRRQRCAGRLFSRRDDCECFRDPVVRSAEDRNHRWGVPGPGRRTDAADRSGPA
jgi:hypothetical protein